MVLQNAVSGNKGAMRAYLAFMGPRLAEMHRLLKDTGKQIIRLPTQWIQPRKKSERHFEEQQMTLLTDS